MDNQKTNSVAAILAALIFSLFLVIAANGCGSSGSQSHSGNIDGKPNFVFILTDDVDTRLVEHMPRLKSLLADQGVTFPNAFVTTPLCCPSRSSILRGQYVHNHQVWTNNAPDGGFVRFNELGLEDSTLAVWMQQAGYRTVLIGKYLNEYHAKSLHIPPGWSEWFAASSKYYDYMALDNGTVVHYGDRVEDYLTDVLRGKAEDFITRAIRDRKPFFVYLSPFAAHADATKYAMPAERHKEKFLHKKAPRIPSFNEEDVSDKPSVIQSKPLLSHNQIAVIDEKYRRRLQTMLAVDEMIEGIVNLLQQSGQLENTYIIFTSDNGFFLGEHRIRGGKNLAYDESIRVPLVVRGPDLLKGRSLEHIALNIDLAPTIAELAGVTAPDFVDGRSLAEIMKTGVPEVSAWRKTFSIEYRGGVDDEDDEEVDPYLYLAVRSMTHKYVLWNSGEEEFYDMGADPYEMESLHSTADRNKISQYSGAINEFKTCSGKICREIEDKFVP